MKKLTVLFFITLLLIGCTPKVIITPDKLPDAVIGKPYYAQIEINGGSGPISGRGFNLHIYPDNAGLEVMFPEINGVSEYNNIAIQGTPKVIDDIKIIIKGYMIPTGWNASSEFNKTYIIKVKESE